MSQVAYTYFMTKKIHHCKVDWTKFNCFNFLNTVQKLMYRSTRKFGLVSLVREVK